MLYLWDSQNLGEYRVQTLALSRSFLEAEEKQAKVHRPKNEWKKGVKIWCFIEMYTKQ